MNHSFFNTIHLVVTFCVRLFFIAFTTSSLIFTQSIGAIEKYQHDNDLSSYTDTEFPTECPTGWMDTLVAEIKCNPTLTLELRQFDSSTCGRCVAAQIEKECRGPWVPIDAEIACAPGTVMVTNQDEACKRCTPERQHFECNSNSDCFRTGCSGQICSSEHVLTTCEWFPYYACYEDQYCVCENHRCTWDDDPVLEQCIEDAGDTSPFLSTE